jgi:ADP-ribose pyrophosphatase YjhB (NUDIX family)
MSQIDATAIMAASLSAARVLRIWQHRSMDNETELRARCGVVVIDDRNRVLLIRRSGEGSWGVPGGGIEVGETWQQAARRECQEETGRDIDLHDLLGLYSDPAPRHTATRTDESCTASAQSFSLHHAAKPAHQTARPPSSAGSHSTSSPR